MNEKEKLKELIIQNPEVCETLLEIVRLMIAQRPLDPSKAEEVAKADVG